MPTPLIDRIKARVSQPAYPPATRPQLEAAEWGIGFRLPDLVRDLYLQVGNGGFGPGYGIIGLEGGFEIYDQTLVASCWIYRDLKRRLETFTFSPPAWDWGSGWIIYAYWGGNLTTIVDCADPALPVYALDSLDLKPHSSKTLDQWWLGWLDGTLQQA